MSFSSQSFGFVRVAAVSPALRVADVDFNKQAILEACDSAIEHGCHLIVFPELCLTGYSCGDLFFQTLLLAEARKALVEIAAYSATKNIHSIIGLPLETEGKLFNCAAYISGGTIRGIVPKTYPPNYSEFYEERWFSSDRERHRDTIRIDGQDIPFGADLLFQAEDMPECVVGIEICEDLWSVIPPSSTMSLCGATLLCNLSASNELLGKADYRRLLVQSQSARCFAAYLYAGAGPGESTTDVVFSGHSLIAENGVMLAETERFSFATEAAIADIDLERLVNERMKNNTFAGAQTEAAYRVIPFTLAEESQAKDNLLRPLSPMPFVPADPARRAYHCQEIFSIQTTGLAKRLKHIGTAHAVIGLSGGLDSTLALLVMLRAFDTLSLDRKGIIAVTMPGFGTTDRTKNNAVQLADQVGITLRTISIADAVRQHFHDIGHDEKTRDITYENAQARERTHILMDIANQVNGIVVGTGDLSELALGWCTYNGDQMSMYGVNAGIPKTLVRYLVLWCAESEFSGEVSHILRDIYDTPVSPELLPLGEGNILEQETEKTIGPYDLHDFFLFYTVRCQFSPAKIFYLAQQAFGEAYTPESILKWMTIFYQRFFSQQFKRSAMPDGPKVGSVGLSPRGDWRMPSDAQSKLWSKELRRIASEFNIPLY